MRWGTNEMAPQSHWDWPMMGWRMKRGTTDMGDQWDGVPMSSNNVLGDQWVGGPMRRGPMSGSRFNMKNNETMMIYLCMEHKLLPVGCPHNPVSLTSAHQNKHWLTHDNVGCFASDHDRTEIRYFNIITNIWNKENSTQRIRNMPPQIENDLSLVYIRIYNLDLRPETPSFFFWPDRDTKIYGIFCPLISV